MNAALRFLGKSVNRALAGAGLRLTRTTSRSDQPTLSGMLQRLAAQRPQFRTVVDVGASNGNWSRELAAHLPNARNFVLIEAQSVHADGLARFAADYPPTRIVAAAAGARTGEIAFEANSPWGGVAAETPADNGGNWIKVPVTTIDREVAASGFPGPYLIKLDTHGFEAPILAGAAATLAQTEALVIECYNFPISPTALRFPAFCAHMEQLGFRCFDLFDPLYRPGDGALWQFDLLFVRADRPELAQATYTPES